MRWDNLLADQEDHEERARLPLFKDEAIVRRFNTPEFRGMTFYEVMAKSIINHVPSDRFGFNWTINAYRGCSHSCVFCFARPTHTYLGFNAGKDFDTKIVVKVNAPELLRKGLRRPSWSGEHIAMGTNTDPYQRAEGHYKITRRVITELNNARNPYSILTKGTLIKRDLDLLREGAEVTEVSTNFSVGTVDDKVWKMTEPGTPHPLKRLEVLSRLNEAGVSCGILMAPIIPGISDSMQQLETTVRAAAEAGAAHIIPVVLHLRPGVKEEFIPWLEANFPELIKRYDAIYQRSYAPKDVTEPIQKTVGNFKRKYNVGEGHHQRVEKRESVANLPADDSLGEQLSLDIAPANGRRAPAWVRESIG